MNSQLTPTTRHTTHNSPSKKTSLGDRIWELLASIKLGVILLIAISMLSLLGTFILQRPLAQPGQIESVYSPESIQLLESFGLLDMYHSWWFILLLFMMTINLVITSIDMWPRIHHRIFVINPRLGKKVLPGQYLKEWSFSGEASDLKEKIAEILKGWGGEVKTLTTADDYFLFAHKGKWIHLGVYFAHFSIVVILLGALIGAKFGFSGDIRLYEGEVAESYNDSADPGRRVPLEFMVRCADVEYEEYPNGQPKDYRSSLEIIENGEIKKEKVIRVNDPLSYKGIYFYQANYGSEPFDERVEADLEIRGLSGKNVYTVKAVKGKETKIPGRNASFSIVDYRDDFAMPAEGHSKSLGEAVRLVLNDGVEKSFWVFKEYPDFDRTMRGGDYWFVLKKAKFDYKTREFTGLRVAYNPGIWIIWLGSALLTLSLVWAFAYSHRKVWVRISGGKVYLSGRASKNNDWFEERLERFGKEFGL